MAQRVTAASVSAGLTHVLSDTPVRTGYLELQGGWSAQQGAYARAEAAYLPYQNLALFGFGQLDKMGAQAGAGVRLTF